MKRNYIAEAVTEGHPDKLCDLIADSIPDACLKEGPESRVACEVLATKGNILVAGENTSVHKPSVFGIIRIVLKRGWKHMFCAIFNSVFMPEYYIIHLLTKVLRSRIDETIACGR